MSNKDQQRDHFRLEYPLSDRPKFQIDKHVFTVMDVSERGIKFAISTAYRPKPKTPLKGIITFADGKKVEIAGEVLRLAPDFAFCVAILTKGVPLAKMMEEQRHLIKKYKPEG